MKFYSFLAAMLQSFWGSGYFCSKKVKLSHTRFRALGLQLIPLCTGNQPACD